MKYGLIGENIKYSLSPKIHGEFFSGKKLTASYDLIDVDYDSFNKFMKADIFSYNGINVTIPYKQEVIKYLDTVSDTARSLNSVNTICVIDGKLHGYNTDILGFSSMMDFESISFSNKDVVILGTGATSNMIEYYALRRKAKSVTFVSRSKKKNELGKTYKTYDEKISGDILINTTPCGVEGKDDNSPVSMGVINNFSTIIDVNYRPFRNKFLQYGIYNNKKVVSGLYMLVAQAVESEKLFGNVTLVKHIINEIYKSLMRDKNIVIIGLTGSGKSTIGKVLAKATDRNYIDLDRYITDKEDKSISELFEVSEEHFRNLETKYLKEVLENSGVVLATGGGVVIKEENMVDMYKNSYVIEVKRDALEISKNIALKNRPLLQGDTEKKLLDIYEKRKELYDRYGEYSFYNHEIKSTVKEIMNRLKGI